jgi:hypothetical protein
MRQLITFIALLSLAAPVGANVTPVSTPVAADRSPRVRAGDSRAAVLLTKGLERSPTLRRLVEELEQRDVIIYIEMQPALRKRLAGKLTWITATPAHRYVRVSINPELSGEMAIATLGHELQHALEVANAPEIVCARSLEKYYAAHGDMNQSELNGWDTEAARAAGEKVRRELAGVRTSRVADSIQELNPDVWFNVYRRTRGMLPP